MANILKKLRSSFKITEHKPLPLETTVKMKFNVNCDRCCKDIQKCIKKFRGVVSVEMCTAKEVATVKGSFDAEKLKRHIFNKLQKRGEILSQEFSKHTESKSCIDSTSSSDDDKDDDDDKGDHGHQDH